MVVVLTPRGGRTGRRTFSRTVPVAERHTAGRHHLGTDLQSIIGWLQAHGSLLKILVQLRQHQGDAQAHPAGAGARYAAEARILRVGPRCINIQAGRLHVKPTAGLPGRRHREGPFDNRTRTRRYLKPVFGCLLCNRGGSWASARTHYLQWRPRCSRCNRRSGRRSVLVRSSLLNEFGGVRPELADQLPSRLVLTGRGRLRASGPAGRSG